MPGEQADGQGDHRIPGSAERGFEAAGGELQEEPAYVKAAGRLAQIRGHDLDQQRAERLGLRLHRGLGLSGGVTEREILSRWSVKE